MKLLCILMHLFNVVAFSVLNICEGNEYTYSVMRLNLKFFIQFNILVILKILHLHLPTNSIICHFVALKIIQASY